MAHELRKDLWRKHFALDAGNDVVKPASQLSGLLDKPADPATWQAIQAVADANLKSYKAALDWIPNESSSIWPVWPRDRKFPAQSVETDYRMVRESVAPYAAGMPFSDEFWQLRTSAAKPPIGIKGFICALPMGWTEGENNHPGMNMILLTQVRPGDAPDGSALAARHPPATEDQTPA
jgi:phospholipase D1/2